MRALWGAALLFLSCASYSLAESPPYVDSHAYDELEYGNYPVLDFKSTDTIAPRVNHVKRSDRCEPGMLTLLAPRGYSGQARNPRATILDGDGYLVWSSGWESQQIYNLMVQEWKGDKYLTFWAGNDAVGGHGAGHYYMLDQTYNLTRKISAANGRDGDLHSFSITPEGTALMTIYDIRDVDLSPFGKPTGPVWDCLIQEIDLETGALLFEWRASDHIDISDTWTAIGDAGVPGGEPFDWFHINSIDKDASGNYIVSSRWLKSVICIDGRTGAPLWSLGGKRNSFTDLQGGRATDFAFQHDARWTANDTEITLFDNTAFGGEFPARGLRIRLDRDAMTATLVQEYYSQSMIQAASQGSLQELPGGNVLVGYGFSGAWAEFSRDGELLCETHYGPRAGWGSSDVQSYRVLKSVWQGWPSTDPKAVVAKGGDESWAAYVSWNGATEVREWMLLGTDGVEYGKQGWDVLDVLPKISFETEFRLHNWHPRYLRLKALDDKRNILGMSNIVDASAAKTDYAVVHPELDPLVSEDRPGHLIPVGVVCGVTALMLSAAGCQSLAARRRRGDRHLLGQAAGGSQTLKLPHGQAL